jgi:signal transduction histidine kinase/ActR/RegA family two-component response regulator
MAADRTLVSVMPSERGQRRLATAAMFVAFALFCLIAPYARTPLPKVDAFIPAYEAALAINDLVTAVLLFAQLRLANLRRLQILASAYLFTALIVVVHMCSFPGVFAPAGIIGGGSQTTAYLFACWHGIFPLLLLLYLRAGDRATGFADARRTIVASVIATLIAVAAILLVTTAGHDLLPVVIVGNQPNRVLMTFVAGDWLACLVACIGLWRRRTRSLLDLWLSVVMFVWLCEIPLSSLMNIARYELGFYAGRIFGLCGASFVLIILLLETFELYARLAAYVETEQAAARRRQDNLAQQNVVLEADVAERTRQLEVEIAEREKAQEQLRESQKLEAIGQLSGGIAHDFNNLLTIIVSNLDFLADTLTDDPERREFVDAALRSSLRGAELTRRLLAFARRQTLEPKVVDINSRLPDMITVLKRTLGGYIRITATLGDDLWPVFADVSQIEDALLNLSINARDAMPDGGDLIIETANAQLDEIYAANNKDVRPGDYVMLSVHDTGTGMPPDVIARATEPFFTTKEQGKGTGLGLSMIYGFAKQSGGHLKIYSEVGFGTTMRLYLPRAKEGATAEAASGDLSAESIPRGRESILLVEDDDDVRAAVLRQLNDLGYRARIAANGPAALAVLDSGEQFDLLFSDIIMPGGMTGFQLAAEARQRHPGLKVLFATGYAKAPTTAENQPGMTVPVLRKPYRKQDLARKLRDVLDGAAAAEETAGWRLRRMSGGG